MDARRHADTDPVDTEIYDPSSGQWSFAGNLPHGWLGGTMILLPDHQVLMVDGWQHGSGNFAEAVIFNPATSQWTEAAAPSLPRSGAAATLLPDGKVLVSQGGQLQSEVYDPAANSWTLDATAPDAHNGGHTFLLPGGKVLLAGGSNSTGPSATAELYGPSLAPGTYVALGDSYSAGVGGGGTSSGGACLQNSNAYPVLWSASHPAFKFTFRACSGEAPGTIQSQQLKGITARTTLITVTAGGDPAFPWYMIACSLPTPAGDGTCAAATQIAQTAITNVIEPNLKSLYAAIRAHAASVGASAAQLIVFGYPDFFPDNLLCQTSDFFEQSDVNSTIDALDAAIAAAVSATPGTTFVDVRPAFAAHELCSPDSWLNGINLLDPVTSFHPNQAGQAQGYQAALAAITG